MISIFGLVFEYYINMKKLALFILLFTVYNITGQQTISGTFTPAEDYKWLIAYKLKPGTQEYVADSAVKEGKFSLELPANASPGTYRIVYAVPQEEFYFDVIYNGKENIALIFNETDGITFTASTNNTLYHSYFNEMNSLEEKLTQFYLAQNTNKKEFLKLTKEIQAAQKSYEEKSKTLLVENFILSNQSYVPSKYEPIESYVSNKKSHYFDVLDFNNPILQSSSFLSDKALNYVFTALPLEKISKAEIELEMQKNIQTVSDHLTDVTDVYKLHVLYSIWTQAKASGFNSTSDFVYASFINTLAKKTNKREIIEAIELHNRLRIGTLAPEITWKDGKELKTLSEMEAAKNYVLVFWSSGCSHCLHELPQLEKGLNNNPDVKVLAVGLESDATIWNQESARLAGFTHAISLGKWESEYADLYDISSTPTYFVLDANKKIVAKPEDYKEVLTLLEKN